ncbi:MAG: PIN domain-containing protein [Acidobacteria bacterium]|nr:PIN domain-containing protein [Acidobacteriota bacterium]
MIFLDTSAIYAWADASDANHKASVRRLQAILSSGADLFTHNYVLVESAALIQKRLGLAAAVKFAADTAMFDIEWVDEDLHAAGVAELAKAKKRHLSLVDHISFLVMNRRSISTAFTFDTDFAAMGFRIFVD